MFLEPSKCWKIANVGIQTSSVLGLRLTSVIIMLGGLAGLTRTLVVARCGACYKEWSKSRLSFALSLLYFQPCGCAITKTEALEMFLASTKLRLCQLISSTAFKKSHVVMSHRGAWVSLQSSRTYFASICNANKPLT